MSNLPSKWVICAAAWGENKRHLYCPDKETIHFYKTEEDARKYADEAIQEGAKMVAVMEVKELLVARSIPYDSVQ